MTAMKFYYVILAILLAARATNAQQEKEFNTTMMESTFKIYGPSVANPNLPSVGTALLMSKPLTNRPGVNLNLLITANHVLTNISGTNAVVDFRTKDALGVWHKSPVFIRIRNETTNLWVADTNKDIAAIGVAIPTNVFPNPWVSTTMLATQDNLEHFEIHPGDELCCLGYPLGFEANSAGFPILRTGTIGLYPLTPLHDYPNFLFNFSVCGGNSGGPVYFVGQNRTYGGTVHFNETEHFIMGVVLSEITQKTYTETLREKRETETPYEISVVVNAQFIKELIDSIPDP
jgi:hypothetical protein